MKQGNLGFVLSRANGHAAAAGIIKKTD